MKWIRTLVFSLLGLALSLGLLLVVGAWAAGVFLPGVAAREVQARTGYGMEIGSLTINPFSGRIDLRACVLSNPEGWPAPEFVEVRQFVLDVDPRSVLGERRVIDELVLDLGTLGYITDSSQVNNARLFAEKVRPSAEPPPDKTEPKQELPPFLIKHLVIKVDRVKVADFSRRLPFRDPPIQRDVQLNLRIERQDVTDLEEVTAALRDALIKAGVGGLFQAIGGLVDRMDVLGLLPEGGMGGVFERISAGAGKLEGVIQSTGGALQDAFDKLRPPDS